MLALKIDAAPPPAPAAETFARRWESRACACGSTLPLQVRMGLREGC